MRISVLVRALLTATAAAAAGVALAEDASLPYCAAADDVQTASSLPADERGDAFAAAANRGDPDPWLVAAELLDRGAIEAAERFAASARGPDAAALTAYLHERAESPPGAWGACRSARTALARSQFDAARDAVAGVREVADPVLRAEARTILAEALAASADPGAAQEFAAAAEAAELAGWLRRAAEAWSQAGFARIAAGDYRAALGPWYRGREIELRRELPLEAAKVLANIGSLRQALGETAVAVDVLEGSLAELRATSSPASARATADVLLRLGGPLVRLGRMAEAEAVLAEAVEAWKSQDDGQALVQAELLWAHVVAELGAPELAERVLVELSERPALRGDDPASIAARARVQGTLAGALFLLGRFTEAHAAYSTAHGLFVSAGAADDARAARMGAGLSLARGGDPGAALPLLEEVCAEYDSGADPGAAALALHNLAECLFRLGRLEDASARNSAALDLARRNSEHKLAFDVHELQARIELGAGDSQAALASARAGMDVMTGLLENLAETFGPSAREARHDLVRSALLAARELDDVEALWSFTEASRAQTLLEAMVNRDRIATAPAPQDLVARERELRRAEVAALAAYRTAARARASLSAISDTWTLYEEARAEVEGAAAAIRGARKSAAALVRTPKASMGDVRALLAPDEAFVSFGVVDAAPGRDAAWAIVATRAGVRVADLGPCSALTAALAAWDGGAPEADARLRAAILTPLALEKTIRRLVVSPAGPLHGVAFERLGAELDIVHVPSASTWVTLVRRASTPGREVLALGDPAYGSPLSEAVAMRSSRFLGDMPRLPASRAEARAVGQELLLGLEATETKLRAELQGARPWRAIHLACHGACDDRTPLRSALVLLADRENDGLLTAQEVFTLRVETELVTLSACSAGGGRVVRGEGLVGLVGAFLAAGAPRVIVNWNDIDDDATRALMERFYAEWQRDGVTAVQALRAAQRHVSSQTRWRHPRFWSGWKVWGLP